MRDFVADDPGPADDGPDGRRERAERDFVRDFFNEP
jgi:hypothetical protein